MQTSLSEGRRTQLFTGLAIALLLFASAFGTRVVVALAVALLIGGLAVLPRQRARGAFAAVLAALIAAATMFLIRTV